MYTDWTREFEQASPRAQAVAIACAGGYPDEGKYYLGEAKAAIAANDAHVFSNENAARVSQTSGISLQTVHEVIRGLRAGA